MQTGENQQYTSESNQKDHTTKKVNGCKPDCEYKNILNPSEHPPLMGCKCQKSLN